MANKEREELLEKANALSLDFPDNIPSKKLQAMIDEASGPKVKEDDEESEDDVEDLPKPKDITKNKSLTLRQRIAQRKKEAFKTRVVTITNRDNRDNDVTTTAHLSFENQYFGLAKNVPLDIPVELEQALIDIAESTTITHHKDEVVNGKRTGNKIPVQTKKYVISYSK